MCNGAGVVGGRHQGMVPSGSAARAIDREIERLEDLAQRHSGSELLAGYASGAKHALRWIRGQRQAAPHADFHLYRLSLGAKSAARGSEGR